MNHPGRQSEKVLVQPHASLTEREGEAVRWPTSRAALLALFEMCDSTGQSP